MQNVKERDDTLTGSTPCGYFCCRVISEEGQPVDFLCEEVNSTYEELTGLKNVVGRRMSEVMPGSAESQSVFFEKLIEIAERGTPCRFEEYLEGLGKWYDFSVYTPHAGSLVALFYDITARKEVEKALRHSEERFRTLFNSHSAIQVLLDPDTGKVLDVNQEASDWYGWTVEELRQMYTRDINTLSPEAIIQSLQSVGEGEQNKYTGCHRLADGSIRDVEIFRNKIRIDGQPVIHVIIQDITVRKQTERALLESEERFRSLFEDHSAVMIVLDPETGNIVDANQAAADFYGWGVDELRRMNIFKINNSSYDAVQQEMERWKELEQRSMSFRHRRADGSIRDVEIYGKKITIMGRSLVYDIVHDVTLRNRIETVSQMRIRLLEMANSHAAAELMQLTIDEVEWLTESTIGFGFFVGEDQASITHASYSTNTLKHWCNLPNKDACFSLKNTGVWADAVRERRGIIHNDYPLLMHSNGMPEGHVALKRELVVPVIRNQKIVAILGVGNKPVDYDEEEIIWVGSLADQAWDIIENKIKDDEQKKLQLQLQHSMKMEMIGQLAAGIAHEINNPFNFIILNKYNLQNDFADLCELVGHYRRIIDQIEKLPVMSEEVGLLRQKERELAIDVLLTIIPETLEKSQNGVERIKSITHSMRSYSFKNAMEQLSSLNLNNVIHEALVIAKSEYIPVATVVLQLDELPQLLCDPTQINQVVFNLIINSSQAIQSQNRSSPGQIEIKTWATADHIYCSVTDDGPGIPGTIRERIFEPFFTTKEPGKGTGLGLNISYDIIVNKHKGTISVDSPPSGGVMVTFSLPIQPPAEQPQLP